MSLILAQKRENMEVKLCIGTPAETLASIQLRHSI
jgi:hypothetical protein